MKRIYLILLCSIFYYTTSSAQTFVDNVLEYDWSATVDQYQPTAAEKGFSSIMLSSKELYQYVVEEQTGLAKYRCMHNKILLNDEKAIENNNKVYFGVEDKNSIKEFKVRVIENGKVISTNNLEDAKNVTEDGKEYLLMAIKGLKKGVILETLYKLKNPLELYGTYYIQRSIPVKSFEIQIISPYFLLFKSKIYNKTYTEVDTVVNNKSYIYLKVSDIDKYQTELNAFENAHKVRLEYTFYKNLSNGSYYSKYSESAKKYTTNVFADYADTEKHLSKLIKKLNLDNLSQEEKIYQIENHIKVNFEVKNGIPTSSTADVIKNKYGNRFSLDKLLFYLYRYANVKYEIVVTCSKEDKKFDEEFQSLTYFDNTLLYFPEINKYLDPSYRLARLGKIGTEFIGQNSIHIKFMEVGGLYTGVSYFKVIPKNTDEDGTSIEDYKVKIDPVSNKTFVEFYREMNCYADRNIRGAYFIRNDLERKELMEDFVKGMSSNGKVTDINISNFDITNFKEINSPFVINAKVESEDFIEEAGDNKIFKIGEIIGLQQELYDSIPRQNPVDLGFTHIYKRKLVLVIPEGYTCSGLEKININNVYMDYNNKQSLGFTSRYEFNNNILTIYCDEYYKELYYPLSDYEHYRKVMNSAADFNKISILIKKL